MSSLSVKLTIRSAQESDVLAMLAIYNHAVETLTATADLEPRSLEDRLEWFRTRKSAGMPILVALDETEMVIGWASLGYFHARAGYLHTLEDSVYIAETARGHGVGSALLTELLEQAKSLPMKPHIIVAGIDGENQASIRLHQSFGFEHSGLLPQVMTKFGRWLDLVYMCKKLD